MCKKAVTDADRAVQGILSGEGMSLRKTLRYRKIISGYIFRRSPKYVKINLSIEEKGVIKMSDCIFCMIAQKELPSEVVYEDDKICVFKDNAPQAPVHVLIIPKKHIASLDDTSEEDAELLSYIMLKVKDIAAQLELGDGYRLVNNCGEDGQQTVKHLHFHLLGRRKMTWPPG